jgi:hypothetical protein
MLVRENRPSQILASAAIVVFLSSSLPVQAATNPTPIPGLAQWQQNMIEYGKRHCNYLVKSQNVPDSNFDPVLSATYYDAMRVYTQIEDYTGDKATWAPCVQAAKHIYRNRYVIPNNAGLPGHWSFSTGMRMDFEHTGDSVDKEWVIKLSQTTAFCPDTTPIEWTTPMSSFRETSYCISHFINAEKLGAPRRARRAQMVDQDYNHLKDAYTEAWKQHGMQNGVDLYGCQVSPFMIGLAAEALIRDWEQTKDSRLVPALKATADYLWNNAYDPHSKSFLYQLNPNFQPEGRSPSGSPDLNLLIVPIYGFLYWQTENTKYMTEGDTLFQSGVKSLPIGLPGDDGSYSKQFDTNYYWSFDYVKWRQRRQSPETPGGNTKQRTRSPSARS